MRQIRLIIAALLVISPFAANADPIQLSDADFASAISGLTSQVEDFESTATGIKPSPFTFLNGTYTGGDGSVTSSLLFCGTSPDICLTNHDEIADVKTFFDFITGTAYWGADMFFINPANPINVVVTGGSGVLDITQIGTTFFGFYDPLGITSVTFLNMGTINPDGFRTFTNYSWDNITTATVQVPEPGTLALFGLGLFGMGLARRRKKA